MDVLAAALELAKGADNPLSGIAAAREVQALVAETIGTKEAPQTAEAIRLGIAATRWGVTASLGVSGIRLSSEDEDLNRQIIERLVEIADVAMYEAKRAGGKQIRHADMPVPRSRSTRLQQPAETTRLTVNAPARSGVNRSEFFGRDRLMRS
jgi:hypothetical protein